MLHFDTDGRAIILSQLCSCASPQACPAVAQWSRRDCAASTPWRRCAPAREETTGVVIGNSPHHEYRVRVQWDDTGEVTHCLKRNLEPAR